MGDRRRVHDDFDMEIADPAHAEDFAVVVDARTPIYERIFTLRICETVTWYIRQNISPATLAEPVSS